MPRLKPKDLVRTESTENTERTQRKNTWIKKTTDLARTENTENTEKISLDKKLKSEFAQRARRR